MANGPSIDVSTRCEGIILRGKILSVPVPVSRSFFHFISLRLSLRLSPKPPNTPPPPHPNSHSHLLIPRPQPLRAVVEMSSATFACILTGHDGVSPTLIHQLSPGRSQQEEEEQNSVLGSNKEDETRGKSNMELDGRRKRRALFLLFNSNCVKSRCGTSQLSLWQKLLS